MRLLVSWVRDFVDIEAPPEALAQTLALRGFEVAAIEPAPEGAEAPWQATTALPDAVIDFEVTANRPDCLSVIGFAREIATSFGLPLRPCPHVTPAVGQPSSASAELRVELDDPVGCPRYTTAVAEVVSTLTPRWMSARLLAAGVRPISPLVDVTNYVLMELGHPMHAFDLATLAGNQLRIRRAHPDERLTTLDGVERRLDADMLVIADASRAQAIAGVMGGASSEVSGRTRLVAFESACFEPTTIRRTSKRLGLKTEASARFERGADVNAPAAALERALELMESIGAGGRIGAVIDRYPAPRTSKALLLRRERISRVLGLTVPDAEVVRILTSLGLGVHSAAEGWTVEAPTFRVDLNREVDLIEEVGRHYGFDKLEPTFPLLTEAASPPDGRVTRDRRIREAATAAGLSEAVTFGFIEREAAAAFVAPQLGAHGPAADDIGRTEAEYPGGPGGHPTLVHVANPLSAKFDVLRPSLLPGLIDAVAHNRRHGRRDVALFEIGARFTPSDGETRGFGAAWTGLILPEHWSRSGRDVDFYDATGLVERLCGLMHAPVRFAPARVPFLVAGQSAAVLLGDTAVGIVGRVGPHLIEARGMPRHDQVFVAEVDLDALGGTGRGEHSAVRPLPRYPSVVRDLSVVVAEGLPAAIIRGTIHAAAAEGGAPLVSAEFFDRYTGKGVGDGAVSMSVRLTFQSDDRTLTDADVHHSIERIVAELARQHQATQR